MDAVFLSSCVPYDLVTLCRPLGPYQLAWYLRQHSYRVQVIDFVFTMSVDKIMSLLCHYVTDQTKVLGIGTMMQAGPTMATIEKKFETVLRNSRRKWPNLQIVVGGSGAMRWSRQHRNRTLFDYVFTGHAEDSMLAFMNCLYRDGAAVPWELKDGNRIVRESFSFAGIDQFQIENCQFRWHNNDGIQPGESLPLEMSRGCIFRCRFCSYPYRGKKKNDFNKGIDNIRQELIDNYQRFGTTTYYMLEDTFNADQDRMTAFFDMVETLPFRIRYCTYLRPDLLYAHPDSIARLKQSGLVGAYLGVETLDADAADTIGKPWSGRHAREFIPRLVHDLWNDDVAVHLGMIAGIPPQTKLSVLENNDWCIQNGLHRVSWHFLGINRDSFEEHRSDFDVDAGKYGVEWTVRDGRPIWKHRACDEIEAMEWQNLCQEQMKPYLQIACWSLIEAANYGIDIYATRNHRRIDYDWPTINIARRKFLNEYTQSLMSVET